MTRWEYATLWVDPEGECYWCPPTGGMGKTTGPALVALTRVGKDGWEAYSGYSDPTAVGAKYFHLKRVVASL